MHSLHKTHVLVFESFIENIKLKFTLEHCCPLICRTDVYCVWFTVTLVHGNKQVAAITTDCIHFSYNGAYKWWHEENVLTLVYDV